MKKTKFICIGIFCLISLLNFSVKQKSENSHCLQSLMKTALADGEGTGVNCDSYTPCGSAGVGYYYNTHIDDETLLKTCCGESSLDRGCEESIIAWVYYLKLRLHLTVKYSLPL